MGVEYYSHRILCNACCALNDRDEYKIIAVIIINNNKRLLPVYRMPGIVLDFL